MTNTDFTNLDIDLSEIDPKDYRQLLICIRKILEELEEISEISHDPREWNDCVTYFNNVYTFIYLRQTLDREELHRKLKNKFNKLTRDLNSANESAQKRAQQITSASEHLDMMKKFLSFFT